MRVVCHISFGVSVIGLASSLVAIILGYLGRETLPLFLTAVIVGSLLVALGVILLINLDGEGMLPRQLWNKLAWAGCPRWMKILMTCLFVFGLANTGAYLLFQRFAVGEAQPEGLHGVEFGGFSLAMFAAACAQSYSFPRIQKYLRRPKCENGHEAPLGAKYCPDCGRGVESSFPFGK